MPVSVAGEGMLMSTGGKTVVSFVCQQCGVSSARWFGRCPSCGAWNSLVEERVRPAASGRRVRGDDSLSEPMRLDEIDLSARPRLKTTIGELDRVLGGGLVPGSVVLLGGDPGIGKSTLALQLLGGLGASGRGVLYVTGEESAEQVKMRALRVGTAVEGVVVLAETSIERMVAEMSSLKPSVAVIDSIQTASCEDFPSAPGSVGQIRESAMRLMSYAKATSTALFLIGHVTKDGAIAGPKVLEHIVDCVLYFEGGSDRPLRVLRAVKNRYGSTNEIGVFQMGERGLEEVANPSEIFLSGRCADTAGSVVVPSLEGTRPILVEIQALVTPSLYGTPRRTALGLDPNRVALLVAVLERRAGVAVGGNDIYVNVPGGVRISETAADLGVCLSLVSSLRDEPLAQGFAVVGEVGLGGEVRAVSGIDVRLRECVRLGFERCMVPAPNLEAASSLGGDIELVGVESVEQSLAAVF